MISPHYQVMLHAPPKKAVAPGESMLLLPEPGNTGPRSSTLRSAAPMQQKPEQAAEEKVRVIGLTSCSA